MSFIFAEKHFDESLNREICSLSCDTKIVLDKGAKANLSTEQLKTIKEWGIVKCTIISPDLCIAFAGNNITYAAKLFMNLFEKENCELKEVSKLALEIHLNTESVDDIEFIILAHDKGEFKIHNIKNHKIIYNCKECYIGSPMAYKYFRSKVLEREISGAFEETVDGCGDNSVGGFPIKIIYGIEEQSFIYSYNRSFSCCKSSITECGEVISFFLSVSDGGFSYEYSGLDIRNVMLKVDQIDHAVIYSRIIRFCEDDKNNLNLSGLMLPMEIYYENGIWKRLL